MINYLSLEEALNKEEYIVTGFEGRSMYPSFLDNDLLVISKTNKYNLYDVVLYKKDNKYVAHRIVDIKDDLFVIRGDNTVTDELVSKEDVLAKIASILRNKKEIKLDYDINAYCYNKSLKSLNYRKIKRKIIDLLKHL